MSTADERVAAAASAEIQRLRAELAEALARWGEQTVARCEAEARIDATAKLAAFGAWCAREFRDSLSDVDGGSAQEAMERLGVLIKRAVTEPCGEGCVCVEYGEFPHECFVFPADVAQVMAPP